MTHCMMIVLVLHPAIQHLQSCCCDHNYLGNKIYLQFACVSFLEMYGRPTFWQTASEEGPGSLQARLSDGRDFPVGLNDYGLQSFVQFRWLGRRKKQSSWLGFGP